MTKLLTVLAVLLCVASVCLAQDTGYQSPSVVVGQTADGRSRVVSLITLKFLDPAVAAQLFGGIVQGGNVFAIPNRGNGEYDSSRSTGGGMRSRSWGNGNQSGNTGSSNGLGNLGGYGGYGQALQQGQQYPGYQSPYGNR